ncbi:hypothetical protein Ancab_031299 [Ancistrocladus abbreviatus]
MEKEDNHSPAGLIGNFEITGKDQQHHQPQQQQQQQLLHNNHGGIMVDYMLNYQQQQEQPIYNNNYEVLSSSGLCSAASLDRLSFADVMQFADFGPRLSLNNNYTATTSSNTDNNNFGGAGEDNVNAAIDPVYFLKFPVLSNQQQQMSEHLHSLASTHQIDHDGHDHEEGYQEEVGISQNDNNNSSSMNPMQLEFLGESYNGNTNNDVIEKSTPTPGSATVGAVKSKRKRPRAVKTNEEVESQRMTHIAVERNRRKQMNEHLRVLRSLMPSSYVQRGDQASIIGGAIEFVRELEQLLQCLESQKRRRLYGEGVGARPAGVAGEPSSAAILTNIQQPALQPPFLPPLAAATSMDLDSSGSGRGLREETAESRSCIADVEVKLLGFDALIKILSRRRPGQLIKVIAALEDLQFTILHTNITTIEQTVLYSFNVKVGSESGFTAEDIAGSVQQIFTFIHANSSL